LLRIVAIVCLTGIVITDLIFFRVDSALIATIVAIIAGLAGYGVKQVKGD